MWDDVIAEPEGIASRDCTWRTSYKCFRGTKHCCYRFLACLFGPCLACCLGCQFACLAFQVKQNYSEVIQELFGRYTDFSRSYSA